MQQPRRNLASPLVSFLSAAAAFLGGGSPSPASFDTVAVVRPLLLLACARDAPTASAAPDSDLVRSLPGYDGRLPSDWYSGYLEYELGDGRKVHTHYVYVERQSEGRSGRLVPRGGEVEDDGTDLKASAVRRARTKTADIERVSGDDLSGGGGTIFDAILEADHDNDEDEDDDDTTPLIFWSNGGPGASSLFGLLTELGPLLLSDDSLRTESYKRTGVPTLLPNPSSWNTLGSLLIFDAPAPVGFSYCDDNPQGDGLSCGGWDDDSSAENNYMAFIAFYEKFPEFKKRPLYMTGESYGGIYVPRFARRVLEHNAAVVSARRRRSAEKKDIGRDDDGDEDDTLVPLRGFAVGDACTGTEVNCGNDAPWYHLEFVHGHGQVSLKTHREVILKCGMDNLIHPAKDPVPPGCAAALKKVVSEMGGFYEYSLYDDCTYRNGILKRRQWRSSAAAAGAKASAAEGEGGIGALWAELNNFGELRQGGALNDYACGGGPVMERWVRIPSVRSALHVPVDSNFFDGDNGVGFNYTATERNLLPFYSDVATGKYDYGGMDDGVGVVHPRVLVYNGDTDPSINSFVAENWTSHVGLDESEGWRPWTIDGCRRMGGYVTRYKGDFDFLTIRGAGHMVPTYKPEASLAFLSSWIKDESYPKFDPQCTHPSKPNK